MKMAMVNLDWTIEISLEDDCFRAHNNKYLYVVYASIALIPGQTSPSRATLKVDVAQLYQ